MENEIFLRSITKKEMEEFIFLFLEVSNVVRPALIKQDPKKYAEILTQRIIEEFSYRKESVEC